MANRAFSNPVVVTVSLAELALAACTVKVGDTPPTYNPPPPVEEPGDDGSAIDDVEPAPEEPEQPAPTNPADGPTDVDPKTTTSIQKRDDGTCVEIVHVDCPPNVMCNPPPPKEVPCPKDEPAGA